MKIDFLADTNFLIYVHEGNEVVNHLLAYQFGISFISEVELLGFRGITKSVETKLRLLIDDCFYFDWNKQIKEKTINLRKKYNIKLPDAIIAATSIVYELPLVTADNGFTVIKELDLLILEI
ncbi:MAG: type II toxin-antitoxin system VapC family toxin [Candidatus Kapabacteria bacterium]|jgi:predicted nucleic acid-binding protein|nr:type II toxin-antitoxin system VapC family toxin [Candidatus Kapabacteria bacterium]